jgi:HD-GYP domain-containing protein (c-di-GMP phosphodiesterase class II)
MSTSSDYHSLWKKVLDLNSIGIALSNEHNTEKLLEKILMGAISLTNADGGTLYTLTEDKKHLKFDIMYSDSLHIRQGAIYGNPITFSPLPLYDDHKKPNDHMVAIYSALTLKTVNIEDVYDAEQFDFSGTRSFDQSTGYRTQSILSVAMHDHEDHVIGVLQLINARNPDKTQITPFATEDQQLAESLASQASVTLSMKRLIEAQKELFESFIKLIATAIDEKSAHTSGHCARVPELTLMIAEAINNDTSGTFKNTCFSTEELYELKIGAWMHDCGKVITPDSVLDKSTKLETVHDRIHEIDLRFQLIKADLENDSLRQQMDALKENDPDRIQTLTKTLKTELKELDKDQQFVRTTNIGGEFMSSEAQYCIRRIAQRTWTNSNGEVVPLLNEDEIYNLCIAKGTLTPEERQVINNHIDVTIKMLESLPYPHYLENVPEIAGGHHERMDGKGFPKGLTREQMSVQARIIGVADIFEALTSSDRPYKKPKTLTESLKILGFMKKDNHIDPDLFDLFVKQKIYLQYAEEFLTSEQTDDVKHDQIPGYLS